LGRPIKAVHRRAATGRQHPKFIDVVLQELVFDKAWHRLLGDRLLDGAREEPSGGIGGGHPKGVDRHDLTQLMQRPAAQRLGVEAAMRKAPEFGMNSRLDLGPAHDPLVISFRGGPQDTRVLVWTR
jgi:hypothetical protein